MQNFISNCDGPAKEQDENAQRDENARNDYPLHKEQLMTDKEGRVTPLHQLHYTYREVF